MGWPAVPGFLFFVRTGDMLGAGAGFLGTHLVHRGVPGFARFNMLFVVVAIAVAALLMRAHRRLTEPGADQASAGRAA
jgi:hypothetical protein